MSAHLKECAATEQGDWCICSELRAARSRMKSETRDAVAGMLLVDPDPSWDSVVKICLEQIDGVTP